ncbi:unnamed protein product [Tilletia caries]|uniref:Uncharacterized protein n=1 Tax=Tilletia caries TaxID=13290 RepID=A0ABN7IN16_9BASI|nr:unnamed protein product [Tilletia caries]
MAVATKSKLSGDTTFELGTDGSFKIKESTTGFRADRDLPMTAWITVMQAEAVSNNIVQSLIRLNHTLTNHPDFEEHSTAIRMWNQHQRRQWVLSSHLNPDGKRFNLGKPNPHHYDAIRLRLIEAQATRRVLGVSKRSFPDDSTAPPPVKVARTSSTFRCFVCFSSSPGHPFRTCAAKD